MPARSTAGTWTPRRVKLPIIQAGVRGMGAGGWLSADITWADYDGDGWLDLYLANGADRQQQRDILYAANGDLTFRNATANANLPTNPLTHMAAAFGDYDGNGASDLYVTDG